MLDEALAYIMTCGTQKQKATVGICGYIKSKLLFCFRSAQLHIKTNTI